jgi:hypothetical protein
LKQLRDLGPEALQQIQALNKLSPSALRGYFKLFSDSQRIIHQQTMRQLRAQLNQYNKYGKSIALQIVAGLRSEQPAMTKAIESMVRQMFPGLPVGKTGAGGRATHQAQHTTHNTHNLTIQVKDDGMSTKKQIEQAAWRAYVAQQRHRH